jgi:hypothetical protein
VRPARPAAAGDPTQRERSRLEVLLRELERAVNQEAGPLGRRTELPLPAAEEEEDAESLEAPPEVVSLETEVRRVAEAEVPGGALSRKDHVAFDQRIGQEPAHHTAIREYTPQQHQDAMVWREILGRRCRSGTSGR